MSAQKWNPRFVAFANAHGHTPEEQDRVDREGTHKLEFILWMSPRIQAFQKLRPDPRFGPDAAISGDPEGFDSFLFGGVVLP